MLYVSYSKFSQLSNGEFFLKIFQQLTKLPSAMQCLRFWTTLYSSTAVNTLETAVAQYRDRPLLKVSTEVERLAIYYATHL